MSNDVSMYTLVTALEKTANPLRGNSLRDAAAQFAKDFPLGSYKQPRKISIEEFDRWLETQGLLVVPPDGTPKDSDAWLGHLQRRHQFIGQINKAATHPRMRDDYGLNCFAIRPKSGMIWIRPPHEQIAQGEIPSKIATVLKTRRKQLRYLMESADWAVLPPYERMFAEAINDDIDTFEKHILVGVEGITDKFNKLAHKIQKSVEANEYQPTNGGIKMLLSNSEEQVSNYIHDEEDDWHQPS